MPPTDVDSGHDYDGIREFDNPLPNWWLATLYGAIVFGFGYWCFYQVFGGTSLRAQLEKDQAVAAERVNADQPITDETLLAMAHKPEVRDVQPMFVQMCSPCHNADGSGKIGPNLTDEYWLHGDKPSEIFKTIEEGVIAKGMPSWGPLLGREKVKQLASYVVSIENSNKPGKAPEGKKIN